MQHKETEKCVKFGTTSSPRGTCHLGRGAFRWCIDNLAFLDNSGCATVGLDTNGLIRVSGWCVHWFASRDIFKGIEWDLSLREGNAAVYFSSHVKEK